MLPPIRPKPIIPSCILLSPLYCCCSKSLSLAKILPSQPRAAALHLIYRFWLRFCFETVSLRSERRSVLRLYALVPRSNLKLRLSGCLTFVILPSHLCPDGHARPAAGAPPTPENLHAPAQPSQYRKYISVQAPAGQQRHRR